MKLPKGFKRQILNDLLPDLIPVNENTQRVRKVSGIRLLLENTLTDNKGRPIEKGKMYVFTETVVVPVNHKRRLLEIIDRAPTSDGMRDDLARYLIKFGKSKEAITDKIPPHLRTKKNIENEN